MAHDHGLLSIRPFTSVIALLNGPMTDHNFFSRHTHGTNTMQQLLMCNFFIHEIFVGVKFVWFCKKIKV